MSGKKVHARKQSRDLPDGPLPNGYGQFLRELEHEQASHLANIADDLKEELEKARKSEFAKQQVARHKGLWQSDSKGLAANTVAMLQFRSDPNEIRKVKAARWEVPSYFGADLHVGHAEDSDDGEEPLEKIDSARYGDEYSLIRLMQRRHFYSRFTKFLILLVVIVWILAVVFYVGFMRYLVLPDDIGADSWNYVYEKTAPPEWHTLEPTFVVCNEGKAQSPINIAREDVVNVTDLDYDYGGYGRSDLHLRDIVAHDTGKFLAQAQFLHGPRYFCEDQLQLSYREFMTSCGNLTWNNKVYSLTEIAFHGYAEHSVDGMYPALEAHLIHTNMETSDMAILAIQFVSTSVENSTALNPIWWEMLNATESTATSERTVKNFQIDALYNDLSGFYVYNGSLTTPSCREGVTWFVAKLLSTCSVDQVDAFHASLVGWGGNARPIQNLNDRKVLSYGSVLEPLPTPEPIIGSQETA